MSQQSMKFNDTFNEDRIAVFLNSPITEQVSYARYQSSDLLILITLITYTRIASGEHIDDAC